MIASGRRWGSACALWGVLVGVRAEAGQIDGEVAVDGFVATSKSVEAGSGQPESMSAWELGLRARARLLEVDDRLEVVADYRGREPLAGAFPNDPLRLLYRLDARFDVLRGDVTWTVGAGRFLAPSVVFLPVDGVQTEVALANGLSFAAFGGRRAITTSRRNVPFTRLLPAVGGTVRWTRPWLQAEALGAWARDETPLVASGESVVETWDAFNGALSVRVSPAKTWSAGGRLVLAQRAAYVLGPTWSDVSLEVGGPGFFSGHVYGRLRPAEWARVDLDVLGQRMSVVRAGTAFGGDDVDDAAPSFVDARVRAAFLPAKIGWVRPDVRVRLRHDRAEIRWGGGIDALDLGVPGLFAKGRLWVEHLVADDPKWSPAVDRLAWSASAGWAGRGFEGEVGASAVERAANPVSGRRADPMEPSLPERSEDLAPFVLESQEIAFVRAFYGSKWWFAGVDVEHALFDAEWRAMLQVGALGRTSW